MCAKFLKKDFDTVTRKNMEDFIDNLEKNRILTKNGTSYSAQTKRDFKIALRKFYKHFLGNSQTYPEVVSWIDTSLSPEYYIVVSASDVEKLVQAAQSPLDKAAMSILFDLGARIEEFLNITVNDVIKTEKGYKVQINFSKTFARTLPLDKSIPHLEEWLNIHPKHIPQLIPRSYNQSLDRLKQLGNKVIGVNINNQIIRHSKATQLAQAGVGRYQMCEWMGWAMSSKMPDRYIRREGIDNQKTLDMIKQRER
jgi:integrase